MISKAYGRSSLTCDTTCLRVVYACPGLEISKNHENRATSRKMLKLLAEDRVANSTAIVFFFFLEMYRILSKIFSQFAGSRGYSCEYRSTIE